MKSWSTTWRWIGALAVALAASGGAHAQAYPAKPVKILVGFAAGGPTDVIARIVAADLTTQTGQTFVVENRPGANAIIATEAVARAAPDGYTVLFSSLSLLVNAILLQDKPRYDPFKDFAPVSNAALLPMVIVTSPETGINSLSELVARAKAKPGELTYGASGHGGSSHLAGAMLENLTGTKMISVPFKGNAPALVEVMSGRVTFMFYPIIGISQQVQAKKLKVLAVGGTSRHPDFPDAPTTAEAGMPSLEETAPWVGLLAPAGTPPAIVAKWNADVTKVLNTPEVRDKIMADGAEPAPDTPAEFAQFIQKELAKYARIVKASGAKVD